MQEISNLFRSMGEDLDDEGRMMMVENSLSSAVKEAMNPQVMEVKTKASESLVDQEFEGEDKLEARQWIGLAYQALEIEEDEERANFILDEIKDFFVEAGLEEEFEQTREEIDFQDYKASDEEIEKAVEFFEEQSLEELV